MSHRQLKSQVTRFAGAVGAVAASLDGAPSLQADVVYTPVDQAITNSEAPYDDPFEIDLNSDATAEFTSNAWFFAAKASNYESMLLRSV